MRLKIYTFCYCYGCINCPPPTPPEFCTNAPGIIASCPSDPVSCILFDMSRVALTLAGAVCHSS